MKGRIIILETEGKTGVLQPYELVVLAAGAAEGQPRYLDVGTTVIKDAFICMDSRVSQSKQNRLVTYFLTKQVERQGINLVLLSPRAGMIDKRIRNKAIIISLPKAEETTEDW